jgi:serine phosphatase RsbU (regulator of sigma subunit)/anti-sigma regulatory factor (Ser/Thr protein kinase)
MLIPLLSRGTAIGTIGMPARDPEHVFSEREINLAGIISGQIAAAIDNAQLYAKTETALDLVERDLEIGRQIQSGFFPETTPAIPGWEIAAHFEAARQVAGDFYDVFPFDDPRFTALIIADVCDKGVGAALYMVLFRSLLRAFSRVELLPDTIQDHLLEILSSTNDYIADIHGSANMFATLFFGILDEETGVLHYINGGHEPPAILDKDGHLLTRLMPTGPAVGLFPSAPFTVGQYIFERDEFLVGYTDGVSDAQNELGQTFTEERLLKYIQVPWTSLFSMLFELKTELRNHMHGYKQFDDITLLSLRRKLTPQVEQHGICRPASLACLPELRDFVETAAVHCRLEHKDAHAFKLAAEEICSNIIQYGYQGIAPGTLSVFLETDPGMVRLVIRDDGQHFPPDQAAAPNVEERWQERQIGGLGLYFVQQLMDRVSYTRIEPGFNQLILEKHVQLTESSPTRNESW